ncbi:MAG: rhomboid family intramembrane serine protease [Acidobacteriia bacterium]|nr:rhomboid family intramembrane serine protease [Terriglobia bacterium]
MFPLRDTQPSYSKPVVTVVLIVINILIFLFEFSLDPYSQNAFIFTWGLVPDQFHLANVFTSMFLHGGWLHVLGNMWFLWIFGDNIEDILGHGKYLLFYLACGVAAGMSQVILSPGSRVPMVGASGAIAGVMGAYMVKFPQSRIHTLIFYIFITTIEVPAWVMLIYWFFIQLVSGVGSIGTSQISQGGTAFFAHIGGFIAGIGLIFLMRPKERYWKRKDLTW